jgi:hypothetical protein
VSSSHEKKIKKYFFISWTVSSLISSCLPAACPVPEQDRQFSWWNTGVRHHKNEASPVHAAGYRKILFSR